MAKPRVTAAGGWAAALYSLRQSRKAGGMARLWQRMRSRNACKTCALGMGGARGGMTNESGHWPEVCKKSFQAQAADMQPPISEHFFEQTPLELLGRLSPQQCENLGRLAFPLLAGPGDTHYRRIPWDHALNTAATAITACDPQRFFLYVSGRSSNEAAFLAQWVARAYGTSNIHNCSYYCHQASGVALNKVYGSGTASVVLEDLAAADFALVIGANPACNHPRMLTQLMHLKRRGGKVAVINPLKELGLQRFRIPSDWRSMLFGSTIADIYLQPHIGTDVALLKALLKGIIERQGIDEEFVATYTEGWQQILEDINDTRWDALCQSCGIDRASIEQLVDILCSARRGILLWAMGLTHHENGVDNVLTLANVALARGWLGRPGSGLLPIRGHSNVQGIGSVGVTPALKQAFADKMQQLYGIDVPNSAGQDTYASMRAAHAGNIDAAILLGGNLYGSNPDSRWAEESLRTINTTISVSTKLNPGHIHGRGQTSLILPALCRDEENAWTTQESMFNFVRISEGGERLVSGEMRSEVDIIASLAEKILPEGRFDWGELRDHNCLRRQISQVVPGYAQIGEVQQHQSTPSTGDEFQIEGRTFHTPQFNTPSGKARFHVTPMPAAVPLADNTFRLMTIRSEGQFNTVVYDEEDLYRGVQRRDSLLMCHQDAQRLGFNEGDRVVVKSSAGSMEASIALVEIRAGNVAMYYPEANVLVPQKLDPLTQTPAFKGVIATVSAPQHQVALPVAAATN